MPEAMSLMYEEYAVTPECRAEQCVPVDQVDAHKASCLCSLA